MLSDWVWSWKLLFMCCCVRMLRVGMRCLLLGFGIGWRWLLFMW